MDCMPIGLTVRVSLVGMFFIWFKSYDSRPAHRKFLKTYSTRHSLEAEIQWLNEMLTVDVTESFWQRREIRIKSEMNNMNNIYNIFKILR